MLLELRVYTLKPGTRPAFQHRFEEQILPMLERFGVKVAAKNGKRATTRTSWR